MENLNTSGLLHVHSPPILRRLLNLSVSDPESSVEDRQQRRPRIICLLSYAASNALVELPTVLNRFAYPLERLTSTWSVRIATSAGAFQEKYPYPMAESVLSIPELLDLVLTSLSPGDLAKVARVARFVTKPALDMVWRVLPTVFVALKLLPGIEKVHGQYTLTRPIGDYEWERYDEYFFRIQEIRSLSSSKGIMGPIDIDSNIFTMLHHCRSHFPLFPRLRSVSIEARFFREMWSRSSEQISGIASILSSEKLLRVQLEQCQFADVFLSRLRRTAPSLRHLAISSLLIPAHIKELAGFRDLEHLQLNFSPLDPYVPFTDATLNELSGLTRLKTLLIHLGVVQRSSPPLPLSTSGFRELRHLAILLHHATSSLSVLDDIISMTPNVDHFFVDHSDATVPINPSDWTKFLISLQRVCPLVCHLHIREGNTLGAWFSKIIEHIEPLFNLQLKTLHVTSKGSGRFPQYTEGDIRKIGARWSELCDLNLFACRRILPLPFPIFRPQSLFMAPPTLGFTNLQKLSIVGGRVSFFKSVCAMIPYITYLVLHQNASEPSSAWAGLFEALPSLCPLIRHLGIREDINDRDALDIYKHVQPLSAVSLESLHLSAVYLGGRISACLSDNDISVLASKWSNMRHLDLYATALYVCTDHHETRHHATTCLARHVPTMRSVASLARVCKNLEYLRLNVENQTKEAHLSGFTRSIDRLGADIPFAFKVEGDLHS